ncbi:MAG: hypothetical protein ACPGSE_00130 [Synechococcus sp.]
MKGEQERLSMRPHPLPVFRKGTAVQVFVGAGWAKGSVTDSTRDRCTVWLPQGRRQVTCSDARNIRTQPTQER